MAGERPTGRRTHVREEDPYAAYRRPAESQRQQPLRQASQSTQRQRPVQPASKTRLQRYDDYADDYDAAYDNASAYTDDDAYEAVPRRGIRARHVLLFVLLLMVVGAAIWLGLLGTPPNPFDNPALLAQQNPAVVATAPPVVLPAEGQAGADQTVVAADQASADQPVSQPPAPPSGGGTPLSVPANALSWDGAYLLQVQVENNRATFAILSPDAVTVVYQCPETWADDDVKLIAWGMNDYDVEVRTASAGRLTFGAAREGDAISEWRQR